MKYIPVVLVLLVVLIILGYMLTMQVTPPVVSPPAFTAVPAPETAPAAPPVPAAPVKPAVPFAPAAPPVPATPPAPGVGGGSAPAASLTVSRMVIAGAIEDRKPVGIASSFPSSQDKVYCYLELTGVTRDQKITYAWSHGGATDKVTQQIKKAERWRTWNYRMPAGKKGDWKVDVLDEFGKVLKSATFKVE